MAPVRTRWIALGIAAGAACFAGGVAAARLLGGAGAPHLPAAADAGVSLFPADAAGPRIFIDPDTIQLLPDASLRLDLPPGFDAGAP
jgi:hypothetical protein